MPFTAQVIGSKSFVVQRECFLQVKFYDSIPIVTPVGVEDKLQLSCFQAFPCPPPLPQTQTVGGGGDILRPSLLDLQPLTQNPTVRL